jgi:dTDP-4-dehydrorhamnose 3,5-epimerase
MNLAAKLSVTPTQIDGVLVIEHKLLSDEFGWFMESYNARYLAAHIGSDIKFVQENQSFSKQWTLRGMHFQAKHPQGKLVSVTQGVIYDVVVDIRKNSATYGRWVGYELSSENRLQMWIPPGLAHGFLVKSPAAEILYKATDYYHPESGVSFAWNDLEVDIQWPLPDGIKPVLSGKDSKGLSFRELNNDPI